MTWFSKTVETITLTWLLGFFVFGFGFGCLDLFVGFFIIIIFMFNKLSFYKVLDLPTWGCSQPPRVFVCMCLCCRIVRGRIEAETACLMKQFLKTFPNKLCVWFLSGFWFLPLLLHVILAACWTVIEALFFIAAFLSCLQDSHPLCVPGSVLKQWRRL